MAISKRSGDGVSITPEVLALYAEGRRMQEAGLDLKPHPYGGPYGLPTEVYCQIRDRLDQLLDFKPWDQSVLDVDERRPTPYASRGLEILPLIKEALGGAR